MSSILPTPRQVLSSLLDAISQIPPPAADDHHHQYDQTVTTPTDSTEAEAAPGPSTVPTTTTNPLRLIPPAQRPLLATLHVLFPSLLLPALDLLDRGLVSRLVLLPPSLAASSGGSSSHHHPPPPHLHPSHHHHHHEKSPSPPLSRVYQVRSAQHHNHGHQKKRSRAARVGEEMGYTPHHQHGGGGGSSVGGGAYYIVHTAAWSCTCAAFAFAASFPSSTSSSSALSRPVVEEGHRGKRRQHEEGRSAESWSFGGYADYGDEDATPPCCKHLLACVLAERWDGVLGRYMDRRDVGREEMAGVFAGI